MLQLQLALVTSRETALLIEAHDKYIPHIAQQTPGCGEGRTYP